MKIKRIIGVFVMLFVLCTSMVFADESQLIDAAWNVTKAVLWAGYAVALGMIVYIGIKYITGAADAKANMKSAIVNYLIGAFIVFSVTTIAGMVIGFATSDTNGESLANTIVDAANTAAKGEQTGKTAKGGETDETSKGEVTDKAGGN